MSEKVGVVAHVLLTQQLKKSCLGCGTLNEEDGDEETFGMLIDLRIGPASMKFFVCELCLKNFLERIKDLKAQKAADEKLKKTEDVPYR